MGKTKVVFVDTGVNSSYCCNIVLEKGLLPDIRAICRHYRWTLQQDGAPAHTARTTMDYLKKEQINFIEAHMWPPNSPDINLVDYAISGALQQRVYHQRQFKTVEELKRAICHRVAKTLTAFQLSLIIVSMNGVDVLKLLSRMSADTSSIATWLEQPHIILIPSRDKFSQ